MGWAAAQHIDCRCTLDVDPVLPRFHYLFSIENHHILPPHIIAHATQYAINYHNSPLPRYAGSHANAWAILNNEHTHGVTWHLMEDTVDTGAILQQMTFTVQTHDTAYSVHTKCYDAALSTWER